jgi:hypothetical protein
MDGWKGEGWKGKERDMGWEEMGRVRVRRSNGYPYQ